MQSLSDGTSRSVDADSAEALVRAFFAVVRSGDDPGRASDFMADLVEAHQVTSEAPVTVQRTPDQYAAHVHDMVATYGRFSLAIDELIASEDKVYVRWTQTGHHVGPLDGVAPTGRRVVQIASCVYRVQGAKIVEYWMQIDRAGLAAQLAPPVG